MPFCKTNTVKLGLNTKRRVNMLDPDYGLVFKDKTGLLVGQELKNFSIKDYLKM